MLCVTKPRPSSAQSNSWRRSSTEQGLVAGEQFKCATPASAVKYAKQLWKVFGYADATAIVRTGYPETKTTILRTYGVVPNDPSHG